MAWTALLRSRLGRWAVAVAEADVDAVDYTGRQCGQGRPQEEQRDCQEYLPEGAGVAEDVAQQALRQRGGERGGGQRSQRNVDREQAPDGRQRGQNGDSGEDFQTRGQARPPPRRG